MAPPDPWLQAAKEVNKNVEASNSKTVSPPSSSPWVEAAKDAPTGSKLASPTPFDNPYSYLQSIPRQGPVGINQIDDMHPLFAQRFAQFSYDAKKLFPNYQISNGARLDRKGHTENSWHYYGQAADVVPDWKYVNTPENKTKLQQLAAKYDLHLLDEWGEGVGGNNSHFHVSLPGTLPKGQGAREKPVMQVSGRYRAPKNIEDFARAEAAKKGLDPDLIMSLFYHESSFRKDAKSSAGAFGIGQMLPETAAPYLKKLSGNGMPEKTWNDYLNNESIQIRVAVAHFADLMALPEVNGNPARALAAYNAGPGSKQEGTGLARFLDRGTVDYSETKKYISNILGIPLDKVDAAVNDPKFGLLRGEPNVGKAKARRELNPFDFGDGPQIGSTGITRSNTASRVSGIGPLPSDTEMRQMGRNAGDMADHFGLFKLGQKVWDNIPGHEYINSKLSSHVTAENPQERITQSLLPHLMLRDGVRADGTVDDKAWAIDAQKWSINHSMLYLPGVFFKELRPSESFEKWRDQYKGDHPLGIFNPMNWGNGAVVAMGLNDLAANLPILNFMGDKLIAAGRAFMGKTGASVLVNSSGKAINSGLELLSEKLPPALVKATSAAWDKAHVVEPVLGYLAEKGHLGQVLTWGTVFGLEGMNKELQRQFANNVPFENAWKPALIAGRNDAAVGAAVTALFPAFGGSAAAILRSIFKFGPDQAAIRLKKLKDGDSVFGEVGKKIAALGENMYEQLPDSIKKVMTGVAESNAKLMDSETEGWFKQLVRNSTQGLAYMDYAARNQTAHADLIETQSEAINRLAHDIKGFEMGKFYADLELKKANQAFTKVQTTITNLQTDPIVSAYASNANRISQLETELAQGFVVGPRGAQTPLVTPKTASATPAGKVHQQELNRLRTENANLKTANPQTVGAYAKAAEDLPRLQAGLTQAQQNPFIVNASELSLLTERLKASRDALQKLRQESITAQEDGRIPDYQSIVDADLSARSFSNDADKTQFELTASRLADRAQMAASPKPFMDPVTNQPKAEGVRVPLVQRELQLQVDAFLLASSATKTEALGQIGLLKAARQSLQEMSNRTSKKAKKQLNNAVRSMDDLLSRLTGKEKTVKVKKEQVDASGNLVIDPKTGRPKTQTVMESKIVEQGAVEFIPASLREMVETAVNSPQPGVSLIESLMNLKSDAFPNGIPIFALVGGKPGAYSPIPTAINYADNILSQVGSLLMSEDAIPAMSAARKALETGIMQGGVESSSIDKMVEGYGFISRASDAFTSRKTALQQIVQQMSALDHVDKVFGGASYFADHMMAFEKASLRVADDVMKDFNEGLSKVFSLRKGERLPADFRYKIVEAIENPDKMTKFLQDTHTVTTSRGTRTISGTDMLPSFKSYFDVLSTVERYKQQSPELAAMFRLNYFTHIHPRYLAYIQRSGDNAARLSPHLGMEKSRNYDTIAKTEKIAKEAWDEVVNLSKGKGKEIKSWEEFAFGFKGQPYKDARIQRCRALGLTTTDANLKKVDGLLHDVLLGDAVTDIGEVLHNIVHSTFRADGARRFMNQLKVMEGPEGKPLLYSIDNPKFASFKDRPPMADYRERGAKSIQNGSYVNLTQVKAFAGYSGGKPIGSWFIHPQAANLIENYLTAPAKQPHWVLDLLSSYRSFSLIGPPTNYIMSLMSNYSTLFNFNLKKAFGLLPIGQQVTQEESGLMLIRALNAGLQPASLLRNASLLHTDLIRETAKSPEMAAILEQQMGYNSPFTKMMAKTGGIISEAAMMPLRMLEGADAYLNSSGLFRALSDAQVGAWTYYTGQIMRTKGPQLMKEAGNNYAAALTIAEKFAADHVNRLGGVIRHHMLSPEMRTSLTLFALAPQYGGAKWDALVDSLDSVFKAAGGRSRHAFQVSPALETIRKTQLGKYLAGSLVASVAYNNMVNIAINGESTFNNPIGHKFDIKLADDSYAGLPIFIMFKPLLKAVEGLAYERNVERALRSFFGNLNPIFRQAEEQISGKNFIDQPLWPSEGFNVKARVEHFFKGAFNAGDILAVREGVSVPAEESANMLEKVRRYFGSPLKSHEAALVWMGMNPTKPKPEALQFASQLQNKLKYPEAQMAIQIQARVEQAMDFKDDPEKFKKELDDIVNFAMNEGVDPGTDTIREIYKQYNSKGNYVMQNPTAIVERINAALHSTSAAYKSLSRIMRQPLYKMINDSVRGRVRNDLERNKSNVSEEEVTAEIIRRGITYDIPTNYVSAPPNIRPTNYIRARGKYAPGVDPYERQDPLFLQSDNPLEPPKPLLRYQRR